VSNWVDYDGQPLDHVLNINMIPILFCTVKGGNFVTFFA
jgi:hypothetical protein